MLREPYSVLVVIQNSNHEFLVLQRADDPTFWQSVTGGIEPNESAFACAQREVLEETGIDCATLRLTMIDLNLTHQYEIRPQWRHRYKPEHTVNTEHAFYLRVPANQPVVLHPDEHLAFKWLNYKETLSILWSESNRAVVKYCYELQ